MTTLEESITLTTRGKIAIITLNLEKKLNALTVDHYYRISCLMREAAAREDIYITLLTDVTLPRSTPDLTNTPDIRRHWLRSFVVNNLEITHAFHTHPKILITALNGPAVGLSAAIIALSDFIYCAPHAFLLTPFTSLGLVAEGGASRAFVQRLGISKANEALIMSKRITAEEMERVGFVNKIVGKKGDSQEVFLEEVLREVEARLGDHLNSGSLLKVKALIRRPERDVMDTQTVAEVLGGLERFQEGVPQEEFRKIASGEKRHKL
ncbi:hypothetical protein MMC14_002722 [Varicellaria rhodocarpa]|nr:hypothetical protein [Varicellaria rhodocarpa]